MRKIQYIAAVTIIAFPLGIQAQKQAKDSTVNRTVVVEQEYNPDIMDASKVNVLPKVEVPTVGKKEVEYDATLVPAGNIPASIMQAYTGKETQRKASPGYVRLGYGNYGNLDAYANYLFTLSAKDRLNLNFQMNGMDGKLNLPNDEGDWNSYYYRTRAGMDYIHAFKKVDLNVAGNFGLSNFNFLPTSFNSKQKFTSGDIHFGVKSTSDDRTLQFSAETNLLFYERQHDIAWVDSKEGIVRTKADVTGSISDEQFIGLALHMDNTFYNSGQSESGTLLENYTALNLNPYYLYENDDLKVRLGAHVDLAFGFGKQFRFAPDVMLQYTFSDSYTLYAQAKGGKQQNDFRRMESVSPYGQSSSQLDATYEQLNAALGFKASPVSGLWFNLYGGYQDLKNDLLQAQSPEPGMIDDYTHALLLSTANTHNIYAGAEVNYSYKDIVAFTASGIYRDWKISGEDTELLAFKPSFEANFRIDLRPVPSVLVNLGYQNISRQKVEDNKIDPISNLYLGGSYEVFKGISIYARANNLLNKNYQYYWGYPAEGLNFLGGVSFRF